MTDEITGGDGTRAANRLAAEDPRRIPAVSCDGRTLTRSEVGFASPTGWPGPTPNSGWAPAGDYVTIALPNSIRWVQPRVAVWKLGAIPQPLSARLPDAESPALLDLRPRALLVEPSRSPRVGASRRHDFQPGTVRRATARSGVAVVEVDGLGRHRTAKLIGGGRRQPLSRRDDRAGDGQPAHRHPPGAGAAEPQHRDDVGDAGAAHRQHLVLMRRFDPETFLRLIGAHRVNYLATVPTIMQRLLPVYRADPDSYDLSLRCAGCGTWPRLPAEHQGGVDRTARAGRGVGALRRHRTGR